jgi:quinoprotein glucose dehydrogenase
MVGIVLVLACPVRSLVAVDLRTGERKWHYQFVHHGIWDMDISSPPILADVTVNGRAIKVVAQATKQACCTCSTV